MGTNKSKYPLRASASFGPEEVRLLSALVKAVCGTNHEAVGALQKHAVFPALGRKVALLRERVEALELMREGKTWRDEVELENRVAEVVEASAPSSFDVLAADVSAKLSISPVVARHFLRRSGPRGRYHAKNETAFADEYLALRKAGALLPPGSVPAMAERHGVELLRARRLCQAVVKRWKRQSLAAERSERHSEAAE